MDSQCPSEHNCTAGCGNPSVVSGNGGRTPPKPSKDQNQSSNAAGSSSGGRQGISSFPPTFSGDEPRPLQTDLFRDVTLFYAHLGPEEEREQWASYLPEYLRPGNIEKYLEETDKPMLYGNNYWWLSQKNFAQEQPTFNQSSDHIRYSRVQLLELRKVMAIPKSILKIKQEIDDECLGVNQITKCGETNNSGSIIVSPSQVGMSGARREHMSALKKKKEEEKGLVSGTKKEMKKCRALINERKGNKKIAEKKKGAEENRKVGVKRRLKIQPLLKPKPKPVTHCRYYLKGRCNEGEKCRFSHDVQPLTKSLPCRHFARQSCMKGDDCPYDHDLSKYPCNKYVSTGFCPRQENCLFSHKVTPTQDPTSTTSVMKPETKSSNPPPASKANISQKPHFVFGANSQQAENSKGTVLESKANQPVKAPKGITLLNIGNSRKDEQPVATSTFADVFVFGKNSLPDHNKNNQPSLLAFRNSNETMFGGGKKDAAVLSNLPALSNSAGVFVFGKNSPLDPDKKNQPSLLPFGNLNKTAFGGGKKDINAASNSPALPNSAGAFVFGKNSLPDHYKKNQPSLLPFGNHNKTMFGRGKKGSSAPSNSPASALSARLNALMKNTSSSGQRFSLSTSAPGLSHSSGSWANENQGTGPVSRSELVKSQDNVHASAGTNSASADASKNGGASLKKTTFGRGKKDANAPSNSPALSTFSARLNALMKNTNSSGQRFSLSTSASGSSHSSWSWVNENQGTSPVGRSELVKSQDNVHASAVTNSASADASKNGGASLKKTTSGQRFSLSTSASESSHSSGSRANENQGTGPVGRSELAKSQDNVHASAGTNSASADASKNGEASLKKPPSAVEVWEMLYGEGDKK